ncbi:uncharacterized protein PG986_008405 [Apiospora aurea]|uniref:Uncharacterized protein n=1 Tax=Apiospora aurea TaxID=335848 RepID=A0ABR1QFC0_9PEZI
MFMSSFFKCANAVPLLQAQDITLWFPQAVAIHQFLAFHYIVHIFILFGPAVNSNSAEGLAARFPSSVTGSACGSGFGSSPWLQMALLGEADRLSAASSSSSSGDSSAETGIKDLPLVSLLLLSMAIRRPCTCPVSSYKSGVAVAIAAGIMPIGDWQPVAVPEAKYGHNPALLGVIVAVTTFLMG